MAARGRVRHGCPRGERRALSGDDRDVEAKGTAARDACYVPEGRRRRRTVGGGERGVPPTRAYDVRGLGVCVYTCVYVLV